jgi:hypothetical protein
MDSTPYWLFAPPNSDVPAGLSAAVNAAAAFALVLALLLAFLSSSLCDFTRGARVPAGEFLGFLCLAHSYFYSKVTRVVATRSGSNPTSPPDGTPRRHATPALHPMAPHPRRQPEAPPHPEAARC